jgi:osmotically-inducible protein OsmY
VLAGIIAGELMGDVPSARVRSAVRRLRRTSRGRAGAAAERALERAVRDALEENHSTRGLTVGVRALGDGIVELTGSVGDAEARPLASTVARGVAGVDVVVNRLLVDGDDEQRVAPSSAS